MKKIFLFLLAIMLTLTICACTKEETNPLDEIEETNEDEDLDRRVNSNGK